MIFDSTEWRSVRNDHMERWLLGDRHAIEFLLQMFQIAETWDDIIDGPPPQQYQIHIAFWIALIDLPSNPFYQRFGDELRPLMAAGINAWLDSVELEGNTDAHSQVWAYALRDWYMELFAFCALKVGGYQHMRMVSLPARQFFQAETLEEFLKCSK